MCDEHVLFEFLESDVENIEAERQRRTIRDATPIKRSATALYIPLHDQTSPFNMTLHRTLRGIRIIAEKTGHRSLATAVRDSCTSRPPPPPVPRAIRLPRSPCALVKDRRACDGSKINVEDSVTKQTEKPPTTNITRQEQNNCEPQPKIQQSTKSPPCRKKESPKGLASSILAKLNLGRDTRVRRSECTDAIGNEWCDTPSRCKEPTLVTKPCGPCGPQNPRRHLHTMTAVLTKTSPDKPNLSAENIKSEAESLTNKLKERLQLREAGQGRSRLSSVPECDAVGEFRLHVPACGARAQVTLKLTLDGDTSCPPPNSPSSLPCSTQGPLNRPLAPTTGSTLQPSSRCYASDAGKSGRDDSWLSIRNLRKKLSERRKTDNMCGTKKPSDTGPKRTDNCLSKGPKDSPPSNPCAQPNKPPAPVKNPCPPPDYPSKFPPMDSPPRNPCASPIKPAPLPPRNPCPPPRNPCPPPPKPDKNCLPPKDPCKPRDPSPTQKPPGRVCKSSTSAIDLTAGCVILLNS